MKALLVQGHGYYGVNVALLTDEQAERVLAKTGKPADNSGFLGNQDVKVFNALTGETEGITLAIYMLDVTNDRFAFDTGLFDEGNKVLDDLLS